MSTQEDLERVTKERDAYKRAKEENDLHSSRAERYMLERDAARMGLEMWKRRHATAHEVIWDLVADLSAAFAECERLRKALVGLLEWSPCPQMAGTQGQCEAIEFALAVLARAALEAKP